MKRKKLSPKRSRSPRKSPDIPATSRMLEEARFELKHEIQSLRHEVKSDIASLRQEVRADINSVKADIEGVKGDIEGVKGDIEGVKGDIQKVLAAVHRVGLLVEEQNARNKYVLDGYTSLSDRLDKVEKQNKDI